MSIEILLAWLHKLAVPVGRVKPVGLTQDRDLAEADYNRTLVNNTNTPLTLTVPANLSDGFRATVIQSAEGVVQFASAAGVVINTVNGYSRTGGVGDIVTLIQYDSNTYALASTATL